MATIKEKKKLIRTIKTPNRYFRLNFSRYGGEVAMGTISKAQYEHWIEKQNEFEEYMAQVDFDPEDANKNVPAGAQFDQPFMNKMITSMLVDQNGETYKPCTKKK